MAERDRSAGVSPGAAGAAARGDGAEAQALTQVAPPLRSPGAEPPPSARLAPPPGQRVGQYVVERTLGHGGMGIVVAARHAHLDQRVAIKLLHPRAAKDVVQIERFVREARATVRIKSEHVVRVLDAGAEPSTGAPFIVMEYLEGRDLGQVLASDGALPVQVAVDYLIDICEAVAAAHALGIIHRDLKPSNFFLTRRPDGTPLVKVLDFGISKAAQPDGSPDPRLTETQAVFGSPTYMSPEQIRSSKNVDPRSDVWSLGVALFELLTGTLPFVADNVAGLLASVIADPPLRVSRFVPRVPAELDALVLGCLEKDPSRRVSSTAELAARLAPFASEEGARLARRVERTLLGASGSSPSLPPPAPSYAPSAPRPVSGSTSTLSLAAQAALGAPSGAPVAVGTTGADLSLTGSARSATKGSREGLAIALGGLAVAIALGSVAYLFAGRPAAGPAWQGAARRGEEGAPGPAAIAPVASASTPPPSPPPEPIASTVEPPRSPRPRVPRPPVVTNGRASGSSPVGHAPAAASVGPAPASPLDKAATDQRF